MPGVPNLGYPWWYICLYKDVLYKDVYLRIAIEGENVFVRYLFQNAHISANIILKKHFSLLVKSII